MNQNKSNISSLNEAAPTIGELQFDDTRQFQQSCLLVCRNLVLFLRHYALSADQQVVESTHQIRKKLKFFRAFTKLLKQDESKNHAQYLNRSLRDEGRRFSELRDSHVRHLIVTSELYSALHPATDSYWDWLLGTLESETDGLEKKHFHEQTFRDFTTSMQSEPIFLSYFGDRRRSVSSLSPAYVQSLRRSETAFRQALSSNMDEDLHEWRKRLKDLQYQLELILNTLSTELIPFYEEVSALSSVLGDVNDLSMFSHWLKKNTPDHLSKEHEEYCELIQNHHDQLIERSYKEGEKLYMNGFDWFEKELTRVLEI